MSYISLRSVVKAGVLAVSVGVATLPDTYFLETIRELRAKYNSYHIEEPVRDELKERFENVIDDLSLKPDYKKRLRIFHIYGYDTYHGGSLFTKYGGVVGVPIFFRYKNAENINKDEAFMFNVPVNKDSPFATKLLNTLVLSEKAQKFAMAREILKLKYNVVVEQGLSVIIHVLIVFALYNVLRTKLNLAKKTTLHHTISCVLTATGIYAWIIWNDLVAHREDIAVDEKLAALGRDYVEGGHEFYEKVLRRNLALRTLLGDTGKKLYAANGNPIYLFRQASVPLFNKRSFFDTKLQNIQQV